MILTNKFSNESESTTPESPQTALILISISDSPIERTTIQDELPHLTSLFRATLSLLHN